MANKKAKKKPFRGIAKEQAPTGMGAGRVLKDGTKVKREKGKKIKGMG